MSDFLEEATLRPLLDAWQKSIASHDATGVAALFTEDAVFQGLHPYTIGRPGVETYYAGQPAGMTVDYRLLQVRRLGDDAVLGWAEADFTVGPEVRALVNLTVVAVRTAEGWRIGHYHVSPRV
ncbi:SgcJ/EcaC family oxidoreductase [Actinoplanes sp. NPDC049596]|uniref:SgcJ/EcaC family oxidoreductase n=1 Tax=unclassified Actinoplanes TaxID=2626549 RepID=UPI00343FB81F